MNFLKEFIISLLSFVTFAIFMSLMAVFVALLFEKIRDVKLGAFIFFFDIGIIPLALLGNSLQVIIPQHFFLVLIKYTLLVAWGIILLYKLNLVVYYWTELKSKARQAFK